MLKKSLKKVLTLYKNLCIIVNVLATEKGKHGDEQKKIWLLGQAVKTPPFHGGNRGSIPLGVTIMEA